MRDLEEEVSQSLAGMQEDVQDAAMDLQSKHDTQAFPFLDAALRCWHTLWFVKAKPGHRWRHYGVVTDSWRCDATVVVMATNEAVLEGASSPGS